MLATRRIASWPQHAVSRNQLKGQRHLRHHPPSTHGLWCPQTHNAKPALKVQERKMTDNVAELEKPQERWKAIGYKWCSLLQTGILTLTLTAPVQPVCPCSNRLHRVIWGFSPLSVLVVFPALLFVRHFPVLHFSVARHNAAVHIYMCVVCFTFCSSLITRVLFLMRLTEICTFTSFESVLAMI